MITKLPNHSTLASEPLWLSERPPSLKTNHRTDYRGHFHSTKIPGPQCLIAKNKKFKVSAYLSTLPLSPPENIETGRAGKTWLADKFDSREVKFRRSNNLHVSTDSFDTPSNYQLQFTPKPIECRTPYVSKHIPLKTREKFDSTSTYHSDYQNSIYDKDSLCYILPKRQPTDILAWSQDSRSSIQPPFYHRKELPPLDTTTSYRAQFLTWELNPPYQSKRLAEDRRITPMPFDSESSYRADYKKINNTDTSSNQKIISSCGYINREFNDKEVSLTPYLEYQRPVFYLVKNEN